MLSITIPAKYDWDSVKEEFVLKRKAQTLQLEHSLISLSKWESKWHKPFIENLSAGTLSNDETLDYIRCMTLTNNIDPEVYERLTKENILEIGHYINDVMTATVIPKGNRAGGKRDILTNEILYYYMIALQIPVEFEKWHLNRLITLIEVCNSKNQPPKKMSQREIMEQNRALNEARKKKWNTKG